MKEMSGRCLLRLTRMSSMLECQESEPQAGQHVFKSPSNKQSIGSFTGQTTESPDAQRVTIGRSNPASGAPEEAMCQLIDSHALISKGQIQTTGRGQVSTGRIWYTLDPYAETLFIAWGHRTRTTGLTLSIWCSQSNSLLKSSHTRRKNMV